MQKTYKEYDSYINELLEKDQLQAAAEALEKGREILSEADYLDHYFEINFMLARILTHLDRNEEAGIRVKRLIEEGYPCPLSWQRFAFLKEDENYEIIFKENQRLLDALNEKSKVIYQLDLPKDYDKNKAYPMFINLHGDGESMAMHMDYWQAEVFLERGYMVLNVQSSQMIFYGGYAWGEAPLCSRRDIKEAYEKIAMDYKVDKEQVIIGGFSGGAIAAIDLAMNHTLPLQLQGVIALCPDEIPLAFSQENTESLVKEGSKVVILEGRESLPVASIDTMLQAFREAGLAHDFYIAEGTGHWYPKDLNQLLVKSLDFIGGIS